MPIKYDIETFAEDYFSARAKFLSACAALSGKLRPIQHPDAHFQGQPLITDVFWQGPQQADKVLVVISATHGVEGFCGSASQINWLKHEALPDDDIALLFIHALNPYGFAHLRRVNEDNIDLNRNFIDFTQTPVNAGYRELASVLLPERWTEIANKEAQAKIDEYRALHGQRQTEEAVSGGQYQYPDGLFFGGFAPSWSRRTIETIIKDYQLTRRSCIAVVDIHSGLGPYGYGEVISDHPPASPGAAMAKRWFGDSVTEPACGTSTSVPKSGLLDYAWHAAFGNRGCYVTLEFGTYSVDEMFEVLREENYYTQHYRQGGVDAATLQAVRGRLRDYFFPDKADWKEMVLFRSGQILCQALEGLRREPAER
ncbi:MAG: M14 family metallopeptidase [Gammaproteobacteria bacterium]